MLTDDEIDAVITALTTGELGPLVDTISPDTVSNTFGRLGSDDLGALVGKLTDDDLRGLIARAQTERRQRAETARAGQLLQDQALGNMARLGRVERDEWVQPRNADEAYPAQWVVAHLGELWQSTTPNNVWEPGASGWHLYDPDGKPRWVRPTGRHDAWRVGRHVMHPGADGVLVEWVSTADWNVWEPGVYGWMLAADLAPEPEPEPVPEPGDPDPEPEPEPVPEWEQRYGHNQYQPGDRVLWVDGLIYRATAPTTYSPASYPPHWEVES